MRRTLLWIFFAILIPILLLCTKDYNPFADPSNARATLKCTVDDGDTLSVYQSETLTVALLVRELIDSVSITADSNRFWHDTTLRIFGNRQAAAFYPLALSFNDTGRQSVTIETFCQGKVILGESLVVFIKSPLDQPAVLGEFGDSVTLHTPPVPDHDVLYHWQFGDGTLVQSPLDSITEVVAVSGAVDSGSLWVTDLKGGHPSPSVKFAFALLDTTGPLIRCLNAGFENKDTILTGDTTFFFKVSITDRGRSRIRGATILSDGATESFDIVDDPLFVKVWHQMDTLGDYHAVTVRAVDNNPIDANVSQKKFWIGYNDSFDPSADNVQIQLLIPGQRVSTSSSRSKYVLGKLENLTDDSLNLVMTVNGQPLADTQKVSRQLHSYWRWRVDLTRDTNTLTLTVRDRFHTALMDTSLTIVFDSLSQDSTPPRILEIREAGRSAGGAHVAADSAVLQIIAFDERSGVCSLAVNGATKYPEQGVDDYQWQVSEALRHVLAGNLITVTAYDRAGLRSDSTIVIYQNAPPFVQGLAKAPVVIFAGKTYRDTLRIVDPDNDALHVSLVSSQKGLLISANGAVLWTPSEADTGATTLAVEIDDGFGDPVRFQWSVLVFDSQYVNNPIAFATAPQQFPRFLEGGKDSIALGLAIAAGTGVRPFSFSAVRTPARGEPVSMPLTDSHFVWTPALADTGVQDFIISVHDRTLRSDTLAIAVLVVPPNRPLYILFVIPVDTLADGSLDFSKSTGPESLFFYIRDPDPLLVEDYYLTVELGNARSERNIGAIDTFVVIIDPRQAVASRDSLTVTVVDRGGHTIRIRRGIYFGPPQSSPAAASDILRIVAPPPPVVRERERR